MRQKALQIRDLVERAKAEADGGLIDVLNKWEVANEHILKKYPDANEMDFSLLEKAGEIGNDGEKGQAIHQKTKKPMITGINRDD
jgi:hypothetical protein